MKLTIIGASGHGKVVADIAVLTGYDEIVFLDDNPNISECGGFPVVGKTDEAPNGAVFVAVGNADIREHLTEQYSDREHPTLVHPHAVVAHDVTIGEGSVIMAGAVINPGAKLGRGVIVNTCSSVDHDCIVGDYAHLAVGAHMCGTVFIGSKTWIGAGATVSNNVTVCENCTIGAGAVVIGDIDTSGTYIGVPAKLSSKPKLTGGGYCIVPTNHSLLSGGRAA